MSRGLDHIVHAVRDLDAAADTYRQLGFTVGARNCHPWGTHNHIVQFPGVFIEVLTFAEPDKLGSDGFSTLFAAYNRDFIARDEGLSMLILELKDARADEADFRRKAITASETMRFEREGKRPDGSPVKVAFSLAFARDARAPDIGFAVCEQHHPENFWNPAFQKHANGAAGIAGVVIAAEQPAIHREFFGALAGAQPAVDAVKTDRGTIEVVTPADYSRRYGVPAPDMARGPRLAALRFAVDGPAQRRVIGPQQAHGVTLIFEPVNS